ncbi:MAG TPA: hypothetical protein VGD21_01075 [Lysobacter sp.]
MGWKSRYPTNAGSKTPREKYSIQALVFDKLKPIRDISDSQWNEKIKANLQPTLQQPSLESMKKCVECVARVWGVIYQLKRGKESMVEVVKAVTAFVPTTGPANVADLISLAADVALDYAGNFQNSIRRNFGGSELSQEQRSILEFLNPATWKQNQTLAQWAADLLYIGECGISSAEFGGNTEGVDQANVDALEKYVEIVRPLLYLYQRDRGGLKLTSVP